MLRKNTLIVLASTAALALPLAGANAQLTGSVSATAPVDTTITQPLAPTTDPVQDTANVAADTAQDAADDAVDAAQDAADSAVDAAADADASAAGTAEAGATEVASAADVTAGAKVLDPQGGEVGTIESVDANGAVVSTGAARVQIPIASFAKNDEGLVISLTKAQLEAQARAAS